MNLSERWLYKVIVVGILVGTFLYFGNRQMSDLYDDIAEYKAELMADRFAKSVSHIHRQWSAESKPTYLKLEYFHDLDDPAVDITNIEQNKSVKIWIRMSKKGWPLAIGKETTELNCAQLWQYFAETRTSKKDMVNVTVEQQTPHCLFSWPAAEMNIKTFRYDSHIGEFTSNTIKSGKFADKGN